MDKIRRKNDALRMDLQTEFLRAILIDGRYIDIERRENYADRITLFVKDYTLKSRIPQF